MTAKQIRRALTATLRDISQAGTPAVKEAALWPAKLCESALEQYEETGPTSRFPVAVNQRRQILASAEAQLAILTELRARGEEASVIAEPRARKEFQERYATAITAEEKAEMLVAYRRGKKGKAARQAIRRKVAVRLGVSYGQLSQIF